MRKYAILVLILLVGGGAAALTWKLRPRPSPQPPVPDLDSIDPTVAALITKQRRALLAAPRDAAAWGRFGEILELFNYRQDAIVCFAQAERLDPNEPRWPYHRGFMLLWENAEQALPHLRRAVELGDRRDVGPAGEAMRLRLSETLLSQGHLEEAEENFRRLLQREPSHPHAYLGLGRLALQRQQWKEALPYLQQAAADRRTARAATVALGEAYEHLGDESAAAQARARLEKLAADPSWPDPFVDELKRFFAGMRIRLKQASQLYKQNRTAEALALFSQVTQDYPNADEAWFALGQALYRSGEVVKAEKALKRTLDLRPGFAETHNYLGLSLLAQGKVEAAAASFGKAIHYKPDFALAHFNLGRCLIEQKNVSAAIEALRSSVRYKPDYAAAHTTLAELLHQNHQDAEALNEARQALQLNPADERAKQLREKLEKKQN